MDIAVVIPCYNEAKTIAKVVQDFRRELPQVRVIVFDNDSKDGSGEAAKNSGAEVIVVKQWGKGSTIQRMAESVSADIYVIVDGDDTYFSKDMADLIQPIIRDEADMVIGRRIKVSKSAMKKLNNFGNIFFSKFLSLCAGVKLSDVLSGYRALNRNFIRNVPLLQREFETEIEMTFQALVKGMRVKEVAVDYKERPQGSRSKLNVWKDGYMILSAMVNLFRDLKPLTFFGIIALVLWFFALSYGLFVYYAIRVVNLLDTIVLISLFIIGWLFVFIGFSLHTINRRFDELIYLIKRNK